MMARLAGWDGAAGQGGLSKAVSNQRPVTDDILTYTIVVQGGAALPLTAVVQVADTVPAGLDYVAGSLTATRGTTDDSAAPTLHWSGVISPDASVTITYQARVTAAGAAAIVNTVQASAPGYATLTASAPLVANPLSTFVPAVLRN